jgi:succinoglycan biosynthesis protein ExoV
MKLISYNAENGNFGDDLNHWLWPQILGKFDNCTKNAFLGIGSILYNNFPELDEVKASRKIVFGTGIRPTNKPFLIDDNWDIKFVRGPLSSSYFNEVSYISDSAYAIGSTNFYKKLMNLDKKYEISIMPYFRSLEYIDWNKICSDLGFNYISPISENNVEKTLVQIAESKYIITEAMHGAIVADLCRVPWHRFIFSTPYTEGIAISEFKWLDWQSSIDVVNVSKTIVPLYSERRIELILKKFFGKSPLSNYISKEKIKSNLLTQLNDINDFSLSKDAVVGEIIDRINVEIDKLKNEKYFL